MGAFPTINRDSIRVSRQTHRGAQKPPLLSRGIQRHGVADFRVMFLAVAATGAPTPDKNAGSVQGEHVEESRVFTLK